MVNKILLLLLALIVGAFGLLIGFLELIAIIDPVGTKMSDDSDPFGDPTISIWQHIVFTIISLGCLVISGLLLKRIDKRV